MRTLFVSAMLIMGSVSSHTATSPSIDIARSLQGGLMNSEKPNKRGAFAGGSFAALGLP